MSSLLALSAYGGDALFRQDARYAREAGAASPPPAPPAEPSELDDPVARAFAEGFTQGLDQARAQAEAALEADVAARAGLTLALGRLDAEMVETLRQRLLDTVLALCEQTLVPYAHDADVLTQRVERAAAMFARADDERVIRLNPQDLKLVAKGLGADWKVVPDPQLARGSLRIETASGGVEDGPAEWRRSLTEAL